MHAESSNTANPPAPRPEPTSRIESKSIGVSSSCGTMTVFDNGDERLDQLRIDGVLQSLTVRAGTARAASVSPTFTIGQRYPAAVPVAHLDLFRVPGLGAEEPDLLADYLRPDTIAFVEWPQGGESTVASFARTMGRRGSTSTRAASSSVRAGR